MMNTYDVVAIGELLIDFTPCGVNDQGILLFGRNPGGGVANLLAMNARLGGRTSFIGKVGKDDFGAFLKDTLVSNGVNADGLIMDPDYCTTLAFVQLTDRGDRSFSFYRKPGADLMLRSDEIDRSLIKSCRLFHFGSVSLTGEPCRTAVHAALDCARREGKLVSYDPNYRPLLWSGIDEAKVEMARPLEKVDLLKVSEEEMEILTGHTDLERGARALSERGPCVVLVSRGRAGSFFFCPDGVGASPAYKVNTIDTTGAGDAFLGAVHYRLRGKGRDDLPKITREEWTDIIKYANAAGSLCSAKMGGIPSQPSADEILACVRQEVFEEEK